MTNIKRDVVFRGGALILHLPFVLSVVALATSQLVRESREHRIAHLLRC